MSTAPAPAADARDRMIEALAARVGQDAFTVSRFRHNVRVDVPSARVFEVLKALKDHCGCRYLAELGGADFLKYPGGPRPGRFQVHYVLRDLESGLPLIVRTWVDDPDPTLPSAVPLWSGADWMEREVFDMYGVRFEGHPDLRRILMPEEFAAFPLRKDYPLRGRGERHNFPRLTREES